MNAVVHRSLTPYDILGYFVPGGAILLAVLGFESWAVDVAQRNGNQIHTPLLVATKRLLSAFPNTSWVADALVLAVALGVAYILGHAVASISAIMIDRAYVAKAHGYPLRRFLGLQRTDASAVLCSDYHRGIFFWANFYLVLRFLSLRDGIAVEEYVPAPFKSLIATALDPAHLQPFVDRFAWALGATVIVYLLVSTNTRQSPNWLREFWASFEGQTILLLSVIVFRVFAWIPRRVTHVVGNLLHTTDLLDEPTRQAFLKRVPRLLALRNIDPDTSSTYWYAALGVRLGPPSIAEPAENWLRLYGFTRNLATGLYLAFLYCYLSLYNAHSAYTGSVPGKSTLYVLPMAMLAVSFLMLLRYYYLFADYYSKYLVRAFVLLRAPDYPDD